MSETIMQRGRYCYLCGRENAPLDRHHVFNGNPNRKKSEELGAWVYLCRGCHETVHREARLRLHLKKEAERKLISRNRWTIDEFVERFGKNYL